MGQIQRKSPFWSLAGPMLGYLAIQFAVQLGIQLVITAPYIIRDYPDMVESLAGAAPSMEKFMDIYLSALEPAFVLIAAYQTEIAAASALVTLAMTLPLFFKDRKLEREYQVVLPAKAPPAQYWTVILFGAVGCVAVTCLMAMVQLAFYDAQYQQSIQTAYSSPVALQVLCSGIVIPLAEELLFRGILYRRFHERQSFWYSAVCSAMLFAFLHSNTTQMVYAFLLGLLLAYLYEKFGSFLAPLLLHIVLNTGSVVFTALGVFRWLGADPMRMAGAVIAGAFVCSVLFVRIRKM